MKSIRDVNYSSFIYKLSIDIKCKQATKKYVDKQAKANNYGMIYQNIIEYITVLRMKIFSIY